MKITKDTTILITGGTGSLGYGLAKKLLPITDKIRIFSRDESKQDAMRVRFPFCQYVLGDVRDYFAVREVMRDVDLVIHAAAFKYLDLSEIQPTECVLTNVMGSINVIRAAKEEEVKMVVGISTDKAPYARNVYGCTKQIMERLFQEANNSKTKFIICRYGNVAGTTGSVIPKWLKQAERGEDLIVTDKRMTRFFFTLKDSVDLILEAIKKEQFFNWKPMKAVEIWRMAEIIAGGKVSIKEGKRRPGEKIYETLIADYEGGEITSKNMAKMNDEEIKQLIQASENGW